MSYFNNITNAITSLIDGMKVTMGYFVRPREHVTLQYPDEVWPIPSRNIGVGELDVYNTIRSKLVVDIDDCIGCKACERACPVNCIHIDTYKAGPDEDLGTTSNGTKKKLLVANFTIDMSECMFCDLCTHPCPEDCITMTPDYQFISNDNLKKDIMPEQRWRNRDLLIYQFSKVSEEERQRRKAEADEVAKAKAAVMAAKKAAAEKAAAEKAAQVAAENAAATQISTETVDTVTQPQTLSTAEEIGSTETSEPIPVPVDKTIKTEQAEDGEAPASESPVVSTETSIHVDTASETITEKETPENLPEADPVVESTETATISGPVDVPIETITKTETFEESSEVTTDKPMNETPETIEDPTTKESENG